MIKNDDERILKMFEMRLRGCTLQEIGETYGISRERVRQIMQSVTSRSTSMIRGREGIIYPNIAKWMKENNISIGEFAEKLAGCKGLIKKDEVRLSHILKGKNKQGFMMSEIRDVLKVTSMTFEEAFKEES